MTSAHLLTELTHEQQMWSLIQQIDIYDVPATEANYISFYCLAYIILYATQTYISLMKINSSSTLWNYSLFLKSMYTHTYNLYNIILHMQKLRIFVDFCL